MNNPEPPNSATDVQNPSVSVAEGASDDPTILQQELAAQKDDCLRLTADFNNFIVRTQRDSGQQAAQEKEAFIRDLLPQIEMATHPNSLGVLKPQNLENLKCIFQQISAGEGP